jgi:hypothetical protein
MNVMVGPDKCCHFRHSCTCSSAPSDIVRRSCFATTAVELLWRAQAPWGTSDEHKTKIRIVFGTDIRNTNIPPAHHTRIHWEAACQHCSTLSYWCDMEGYRNSIKPLPSATHPCPTSCGHLLEHSIAVQHIATTASGSAS